MGVSVGVGKTSHGFMREASGMAGFLKVLLGNRLGASLPINHLKVLSPPMCLEVSEEVLNAVTEATGFRTTSSYSYVNCMGLGGSNAAVISFGGSSQRAQTTSPPTRLTNVTFWP